MNNERLFNLVLLELSSEKMSIEDSLEKIIASNKPILQKTKLIRKLLSKLNMVEANIAKFNSMISNNNNITNEKTD